MYSKNIRLGFMDCYASVDVSYVDGDCIILSLTEMDEDEERSKEGYQVVKEVNAAEVALGTEEVKEIIKALQEILPKEEN